MTERELIKGIAEQERSAIRYLVEKHQQMVIKTAYYYTHDLEDAEDIAQEVFLEVISSIMRFRAESSLITWIYRITVNRALNVVKKNSRRALFMGFGGIFKGPHENQERLAMQVTTDPLDVQEMREMLNKAIDSLPVQQRTAFILYQYEEIPYQEIAQIMQTTVPSVESLLHRARVNLRKKLSPYFMSDLKI